jgi:hypothetical protein
MEMRGAAMTVRTPIRKGHGRLSMFHSAPFPGGLRQAASVALYDLDPAECEQLLGDRITQSARHDVTERARPRWPA